MDDYSIFTWTLFLRTKDETFPVFAAFVKKIQLKMSHNVVSIRSDHGIEFDNVKFDEFCAENGISHNFSAPRTPQQNEAVNTACYLVNKCMIRSLLNKTPYELLNGRKPKLTHLRTFGCKCFVLNNGKEASGKFDAKSDEVIDMANGKADMMSQVKESNEDGAAESPTDTEEHVPSITTTEAENRVIDAVQGTLDAELRSGTYVNNGSHSEEPGSSRNEIQAPHAWYERLSKFLLENGFTRGKIDNTLFLKKRGRNLLIVQVYVDDIIFSATNDSLCAEFAKLNGSEVEMSMMGELNFFLGAAS
ncbi:uncharacterized protein LOC107801533 [Nicotiana tabacum]|uniref:Uncharacterized protein LOC107801533 n=1 Tax=Nicotiana tabacum TaxID=4097 RepID=A0AC58SEJ6_TOBAC